MWRRNLLARIVNSRDLCRREPVLRSPCLDGSKKLFSTTNDEQEAAIEAFTNPPTEGLVYGRLNHLGKNTLKTDIIHLFDECNLKTSDIRFEYSPSYNPLGMILQFPSRAAFNTAGRLLLRKGRLYRFDKVDRGHWDLLKCYDGKVVLLQGVPRNALPEDVERFLSGCNFKASNIQMFVRSGFPDPIRMALINFPTQLDAMNAFRTKNRGFCLNNPISMRVLQ